MPCLPMAIVVACKKVQSEQKIKSISSSFSLISNRCNCSVYSDLFNLILLKMTLNFSESWLRKEEQVY